MVDVSRGMRVFEQARQHLVGGVSASARVHPALGRPVYMARGEGARVWDVDGREYLDLCNSHGATLLGHGHPAIARAIVAAVEAGLLCAYETEEHGRLADRLNQIIPSAEMVRYTNTGTETTYYAVRTARAFTGRDHVVKFEGHFHGLNDYLAYSNWPPLDQAGPARTPTRYHESAGIPESVAALTHVVPFNDLAALEEVIRADGHNIAAIILEPVNVDSWVIHPKPGYLAALRQLASENGIVLIFDEILCGFRTGPGGVQADTGVTPDLTTLGKPLGGATVLSALLGRQDIMSCLTPLGRAVHTGTYNAHLIPIMAAHAFLDEIGRPEFYPNLLARSERLVGGLRGIFARAGVKAQVRALGARFSILFGAAEGEELWNYRDAASRRDAALELRFLRAALDNGVFVLGFHHGLSAAFDDADVDTVLDRLETATRRAVA
jgi:glutamate-1-semialdehyde 2,1-aminomutase